MVQQFHLAWFVANGFGVQGYRGGWDGPWSGSHGQDFAKPDFYVDMARQLERAGFDYIMLEDSSNVPYTLGNSHEQYLKHAITTPKHDPAQLAPILAYTTNRLGIIPTLSTSEYHPYMLARLIGTLDHLSDGRAGWNIVTGSNDGAAQNYGREGQYPHDERYDRADEFVDVVTQLIESWDPDAVVMDRESGTFADFSKVRPIHYEGQYFRSRGPLNVTRPPQGRPVYCQAGGSPRGRTFAAGTADTIIASMEDPDEMKEFREDIRARAVEAGRDPDAIKVMFLIDPVLAETQSMAEERLAIIRAEIEDDLTPAMANFARVTGIDWSTMDPDAPISDLKTNGHQSVFAKAANQSTTVRELIMTRARKGDALKLVGTPDAVASQMEEIIDHVGGDGFLIGTRNVNRHAIAEVTEGLVPVLQRRGRTRTAYEHATLRENLLAF